jgi:hypothetical protein
MSMMIALLAISRTAIWPAVQDFEQVTDRLRAEVEEIKKAQPNGAGRLEQVALQFRQSGQEVDDWAYREALVTLRQVRPLAGVSLLLEALLRYPGRRVMAVEMARTVTLLTGRPFYLGEGSSDEIRRSVSSWMGDGWTAGRETTALSRMSAEQLQGVVEGLLQIMRDMEEQSDVSRGGGNTLAVGRWRFDGGRGNGD